MPIYNVNGKTYNIPDSLVDKFEKDMPDASIRYENEGKLYDIPLSKKDGFTKAFPNAHFYGTEPVQQQDVYPQAVVDAHNSPNNVAPHYKDISTINREYQQTQKAKADVQAEEAAKVGQFGNGNMVSTPNGMMPDLRSAGRRVSERQQARNIKPLEEPQPYMAQQDSAIPMNADIVPDSAKPEDNMAKKEATAMQVSDMMGRVDQLINEAKSTVTESAAQAMQDDPMGTARMAMVDGLSFNQLGTAVSPQARAAQTQVHQLETIKRSLQDSQNIIDEANHNAQHGLESTFVAGAVRGAGQKLFDARTWDMGIRDMEEQAELSNALQAFDEGKQLTKVQQMLLDAKALELATNAYFGSEVGRGYKAGQVTAEAIPFMLEMAINPASGIGKTLGSRLTRYALKRFSKQAAKKALTKTLGAAGQVAGDIAGSAAMTATTGNIRTAADAMRRMNGNIQFDTDESGKSVFAGHTTGEDALPAFAKAFASTTIENHSEMVGEYFSPLLGLAGGTLKKGFGKAAASDIGKAIRLDKVGDFINDVATSDVARLVNDFEKNAKWSGTFAEFAEEIIGGVENALIVGDQTLDADEQTGVFNTDNMIDTFLGVSLMGGFMSAAKTLGYQQKDSKFMQYLKTTRVPESFKGDDSVWEDILSDYSAAEWKADQKDATGNEGKDYVRSVLERDDLNWTQKRDFLNMVKAKQEYRGEQKFKAKEELDNETSETEQLTPEQRAVNEAEESRMAGYDTTEPAAMNEAKNDYEAALADIEGSFSPETIAAIDANPTEELRLTYMNPSYSDEDRQRVLDYVNAKQRYDGMVQRVRDDIDGMIQASDAEIDSQVNTGTGMVQPATLKVDNRQVHIIDGNVALLEDGSIDTANSTQDIIVRDAQTGKVEFVSPSAFLGVDEAMDPAALKQQAAENIRQTKAQQAANQIDGVLPFQQGDTYDGVDAEGQPVQVQIISDNGDGTVNVGINGEAAGVPMQKEAVQQLVDNARRAQAVARREDAASQRAKNTNLSEPSRSMTEGKDAYSLNEEVRVILPDGSEGTAIIRDGLNADGQYLVEFMDEAGNSAWITDENGNSRTTLPMTADQLNAMQPAEVQPEAEQQPAPTKEAVNSGLNGEQEQPTEQVIKDNLISGEPIEIDTNASYTVEQIEEMAAKLKARGVNIGSGDLLFDVDDTNLPEQISGSDIIRSLKMLDSYPPFPLGLLDNLKKVGVVIKDMPMIGEGEDMEPDFAHVSPQRAQQYLYDESGLEQDEADDFVKDMQKQAEKDLQALQKKKPKLADKGIDNKIPKFQKAKAAWQQQVDEAQRKVDYWNSVEQEQQMKQRQAREAAEAERLAAMTDEERLAQQRLTEQDAQNLEEIAAQMIGSGSIKLNRDSYKQETGYSESEAKKMFRIFATDGMSVSRAGEQIEQAAREAGIPFDETDANAGRNAVISVLQSAETWGDLLHYIEKNRQAEADALLRAAEREQEELLDRLAIAYNFASGEDYRAYEEFYLPMYLSELDAATGEEYYAAIADDINHLNEIENGERTDNSEGEGSPAVLPEEQSSVGDRESAAEGQVESEGSIGEVPSEERPASEEASRGEVEIAPSDQLKPIGRGAFGGIYDQFRGKPSEAIAFLIQKQDGEALGALHHKDIGEIDLVWGKAGTKKSDGYGLAKLVKYHPEVLDNLQEILDDMHVTERSENRIQLESETHQAAVRLTWDNKNKNWLLTAFEKKETSEPTNSRTDVESNLEGMSDDTATRQDSDVSESKDNTSSDNIQENQQENEEQIEKELESRIEVQDIPTWPETATENGIEYHERVVVDGKHNVLKVDAPDEKGNYTGSYYLYEGKHFGSIVEVVDYIDGKQSVQQQIEVARKEVAQNPTEAQKEAGNYKKGHIKLDGYDISIENPKGSTRSGVDEQGKEWSVTMNNDYGYLRGTEGVDGDHIDVFLSDEPTEGNVFVVDQVKPDGSFDEHKVMYGFATADEARAAYLANYSPGWTGLGAITEVSKDEFKKWVESSHRKTKPFAEYKSVKPISGQNEGNTSYSNIVALSRESSRLWKEYFDLPRESEVPEEQKEDARKRQDEASSKWIESINRLRAAISRLSDEEIAGIEDALGEEYGYVSRYVEEIQKNREAQRALAQVFEDGITAQGEVTGKDNGKDAKPEDYTKDNEEQRPVLHGTFHDPEGYAVVTNARVLLADKKGFEKSHGGKVVAHREIAGNKKGDVIEGNFPKWKNVIKPVEDHKDATLDAAKLLDFIAGAEERMKSQWKQEKDNGQTKQSFSNWSADADLVVRMPDGTVIGFNFNNLRLFAKGARQIGADSVEYTDRDKGIAARSDSGVVTVMPKLIEGEGNEGRRYFYDMSETGPEQPSENKDNTPSDNTKENGDLFAEAKTDASESQPTDKPLVGKALDKAIRHAREELRHARAKLSMANALNSPYTEEERKEKAAEVEKWKKELERLTGMKKEAPTASASVRASTPNKIEDFGEKIGGARKDVARGRIRDTKQLSVKDLTTLKKGADDILSQANILRLYREGQMDEQTARSFMAFNNVVKLALKKGYGNKDIVLGKYRDAAVAWEEGKPFSFEITEQDVKDRMAMFARATEEGVRQDLEYAIKEPYDDFMQTYEALNYPAEERKLGNYVIKDYTKSKHVVSKISYPFWVKNGYRAQRGYPFRTLADAVTKIKNLCPLVEAKEKNGKSKGESTGHGLHVAKDGSFYYVKSRNIPGTIYLSRKFFNERDAKKFLEDNLEKLKEREQRMVDALMGSSIGMAEREGVDYRGGRDVTPQDFLDEFGFRGVEFGNWVPQAERQLYLNKTYDAIEDLCAIIGISPKAFSLGGRLGLAFGARGHGRAMAHYESGKEVINLTRMSGTGSLAHEWFHALDNYLARQKSGNVSDFATETHDTVRTEVGRAFSALYDKMRSLDYHRRSQRAGREYWGKTVEEFARLFENYVYNKLAERQTISPVLVREDTLLDQIEDEYTRNAWPYPSRAENEEMKPLFDSLFETIQEETDDNGNIVLFQKVDGSEMKRDADAAETALRDALIDTMREAGIDVITDAEAGQQLLDMANEEATLSRDKKRASESVSVSSEEEHLQAVDSDAGTKIIHNLENLAKNIENIKQSPIKTFLGEVARAIGARKQGSNSQYATFETKNGQIVTIRLADHNAHTSGFDNSGRNNGISIVVSPKKNNGVNNDGKAHVVEYYYDAIKLRRAEGKPLAQIVRSIQQALHSGEYKDTTGLAKREEVNPDGTQEIMGKVQFFRTSNGDAYGFTVNGKIYIDPRIATAETPIHEYGHLWTAALRKANPAAWERLKEQLLGQKDVVDYVKSLYPELEGDALMDEIFQRYAGKRGAERLRSEQQRLLAENNEGAFGVARIVSVFDTIRRALQSFWNQARELFAGNNANLKSLSAEDFADMMMADLLYGYKPDIVEGSDVMEQRAGGRDSQTAYDFATRNKGVGRVAVVNAETGYDILRQRGVDAAKAREVMNAFKAGDTGRYLTKYDLIIAFDDGKVSEEELNSYLWHEATHRVIHSYGITQDTVNAIASYIKGIDRELYDKVMRLYGDSSEEVKNEEVLAWFMEDMAKTPEELIPSVEASLNNVDPMDQQIIGILKLIRYGRTKQSKVTYSEVDRGSQGTQGQTYNEVRLSEGTDGTGGRSQTEGNNLRGTGQEFSRRGTEIGGKAEAREAYEAEVARAGYQVREALQDSMRGLYALYKAVLGDEFTTIEDVPGFENAYTAENFLSSADSAQQTDYEVRYFSRITDAVYKLTGTWNIKGGKYQELTDYMMAKHGLERNVVLAERDARRASEDWLKDALVQLGGRLKTGEIDQAQYDTQKEAYERQARKMHDEELAKNRKTDYAGLTALTGKENVAEAEAAARQMVADYETEERKSAIDKLWKAVRDATHETLRKTYEGGLMSKEAYESTLDMFQYYIPLRGFNEKTSDQVYDYLTSNDGPLKGSVLKTAGGRKSKADDPIAYISQMANKAIMEANRNRMKQTFMNFVLNHPSDLVSVSDMWIRFNDASGEWEPELPPYDPNDSSEENERKRQVWEENMKHLAASAPKKYKRASEVPNIPYRVLNNNLREHQVLVKRGGRTYVLTINGSPRAAEALNGLTNPDTRMSRIMEIFQQVMGNLLRFMSNVMTTGNPNFVLSNFLRDFGYTSTIAIVKENANYAKHFEKNRLRFNPVMLHRMFRKFEKGTLDDSNETERLFRQFMVNGGETGYTNVLDIIGHKKEIGKALKRKGNLAARFTHAIGLQYDLLNRSVENVARFAAFVTSREMGRSLERSIWDAKEISVNFNKKGSADKFFHLDKATAAGNVAAAVSTIGRLTQVFFNAAVQAIANYGTAGVRNPRKFAVIVSSLVSLGYMQGIFAELLGGDDDDEYENLPEYLRRSSLVVRVPDTDYYATLPLTQEYRAFFGMGELLSGIMRGKEKLTPSEAAVKMAELLSQALPVDMMEGGGGLSSLVASQVKPVYEVWVNKDWNGLPIYRKDVYPGDERKPEWTRVYKSADKTLVALSKALSHATGGVGDFQRGWLEINPAVVEHVIDGYLGGYWKTALQLKKTAETLLGERDFEPRNIFLLNRIMAGGDERTANSNDREKFYKYKEEAEDTRYKVRNYEKAQDLGIEGMAEKINFLNYSPEYGRMEIYERYKPEIDGLNRSRKTALEEGDDEAVADYDADILDAMRRMNAEMEEFDKKK